MGVHLCAKYENPPRILFIGICNHACTNEHSISLAYTDAPTTNPYDVTILCTLEQSNGFFFLCDICLKYICLHFLFAGVESYPEESASRTEVMSPHSRLCENSGLDKPCDSPATSRCNSPDGRQSISSKGCSPCPEHKSQAPRAVASTSSTETSDPTTQEKPKIWSVADMTSSRRSVSPERRRSSSEDRDTSSSSNIQSPIRSPAHTQQTHQPLPVRPSVSMGAHLGGLHPHPGLVSGSSVPPTNHPHFNGLRHPWMGLSMGYPLAFHQGALAAAAAHPYFLAATPNGTSPISALSHPAIRNHHELLKLQASSMHLPGK